MFCVPLGLQPMMNNWVFPRSTALFAGSAKCLTKRVFFQRRYIYSISGQHRTSEFRGTSYPRGGLNHVWILKRILKYMLEYIQSMSLSLCNRI